MSALSSKTPPPAPGAERRRHERFEIFAQVEMRADDDEVTLLLVKNISVGGALLAATEGEVGSLSAGDKVNVFVDASNGAEEAAENQTLSSDASVVRIDHGSSGRVSIAVQWAGADPTFPDRVAAFVEAAQAKS